jgi:hypothetical protein
MSRKRGAKPYWEMTTDELREATKELDNEFAADNARPLTPQMRARWQRAKNKKPGSGDGKDETTIVVRLKSALLQRCNVLAKKKGISRNALIIRGLKALLGAEGQV